MGPRLLLSREQQEQKEEEGDNEFERDFIRDPQFTDMRGNSLNNDDATAQEYSSVQDETEPNTLPNDQIIDDISSRGSSSTGGDNYTFDEDDREAQKQQDFELEKALVDGASLSTPLRITRNTQDGQDSVMKESVNRRLREVEEIRQSKYNIPPPMPLDFPTRPKGVLPSEHEDDPEKAKLIRFLKMIERKNEANEKRLTVSQQADRNTKSNLAAGDYKEQTAGEVGYGQTIEEEFEERDVLHKEGLFELHRKRKVNQRIVRGYCQMLDVDYNHNRIIVCGYQAHILRTVSTMIQRKPPVHGGGSATGQQKVLGSN